MESLLRKNPRLRKELSKNNTCTDNTKVALWVNPVLGMDLTSRFQINKPLVRVIICQELGAGELKLNKTRSLSV